MLGVEPSGQLGMAAKSIHGAMVVPAPVHVAGAALVPPHIAELRVEHRLTALAMAALEVPRRAGEGAVTERVEMRLPSPSGQILVPGVEVRHRVSDVAARGIVLDETRPVEPLRQSDHAGDLALRRRGVPIAAADFTR